MNVTKKEDLRIFKNGRKYICRFVYFPAYKFRNYVGRWEDVPAKYKRLEHCELWERRLILEHGKSDVVTESKPNLMKLYKKVHISMIKFGGGYTGDEILFLAKYAKENGCMLLPMSREAHGGGRGARGWGVVHFAKYDVVREIIGEMGILDEYDALPVTKRIDRQRKLFGEMEKIEGLTVKIIPDIPEYEGLIFLSDRAIAKHGLPFGVKFSATMKGLGVPVPKTIGGMTVKFTADVNVPVSENKFDLTAEKLANSLYINRRLSAEYMFSRILKNKRSDKIGRLANMAWDFRSMLGIMPNADLKVYRDFYERGIFDDKLLDEMFGFVDRNGKERLQNIGLEVKAGKYRFDPDIEGKVNKSLWTVIKAKMLSKFPGSIYGNIMPLEYALADDPNLKVKYGWFTRYPWMDLMLTKYAVYKNTIAVPDAVVKLFGGDYDGDLGLVIHRRRINSDLVYHKMKDTLESWMKMPDKEEVDDSGKSEIQAVADVLDFYSSIGKSFNAGRVAEGLARREGWSRMKLMELRLKITASIVQPFINGLKYVGGKDVPGVEAICKMYGIPITHLDRETRFFQVFRTRLQGVGSIIDVANELKANVKSNSFYEALAANSFMDWSIKKDPSPEDLLRADEYERREDMPTAGEYEPVVKEGAPKFGASPVRK